MPLFSPLWLGDDRVLCARLYSQQQSTSRWAPTCFALGETENLFLLLCRKLKIQEVGGHKTIGYPVGRLL